jgi:hypothetical protein
MSESVEIGHFDPEIPGLNALLKQSHDTHANERGFAYHKGYPFNMVMYGPSGVGKTTIALQMAVAAAKSGRQVIYLTKDTHSNVLFDRIINTFYGFDDKPCEICHEQVEHNNLEVPFNVENGKTNMEAFKRMVRFSNKTKMPFLFLGDNAQEVLLNNGANRSKDTKHSGKGLLVKIMNASFFAFADFAEAPSNIGKLDRYGMTNSAYDILGDLVPSLKPLFAEMGQIDAEMKPKLDLFIVCDALSSPALEEKLRLNTAKFPKDKNTDQVPRVPLCLFVMESDVMPQSMTVAFPPDVQITLGKRKETEDIQSRTIQLLKTRYQDSLADRAPYVIRGYATGKQSWKPGVEVFPPLSRNIPCDIVGRTNSSLQFGIDNLDNLILPNKDGSGGLEGGGCTVLVTDHGCKADAFSFHYLLGDVSSCEAKTGHATPRSMLYIGLNEYWGDVKATIRRFRRFDNVLCIDDKPGPSPNFPLCELYFKTKIDQIPDRALHFFLPGYQLRTSEQILQQIATLLLGEAGCKRKLNPDETCLNCYKIDRVVLDRVSRITSCWPFVKDVEGFVSALVAMCQRQKVDLLLIDDTATKDETTANFHSRWRSMAQNIIRLRRVPFHGAETTTIEMVMVGGGRLIKLTRPHELVEKRELVGKQLQCDLDVLDTFRGHTFLPSGEPVRCKVKVELCYDSENTPLYQEVLSMKQSIEAAMDGVDVKILGRGEWAGINSAFSSLTSGSRDTCHVVAIDGIGLQHLLKSDSGAEQVLHMFSATELEALLPKQIQTIAGTKKEDTESTKLDKLRKAFLSQYITRSSYIAMANFKNNADHPAYFSAIPMRQNWGVLAVTELSPYALKILAELFPYSECKKDAKKNAEQDVSWTEVEQNYRFLCYRLVKQSKPIVKWAEIASLRTGVWHSFWKQHNLEEAMTRNGIKHPNDLWYLLFPRIDLFGIAMTSEESVVSFLIELLLAEVRWDMLFVPAIAPYNPIVGMLKLCVDNPNDVPSPESVTEYYNKTLYLFYRLLSARQRRQLAIGVSASHEDIASNLSDQLSGKDGLEKQHKAWPRQTCLISRQWISTVTDMMPRYDVRKTIHLSPLPGGDVSQDNWMQFDFEDGFKKEDQQTGIPVAGTWYLGVLNGGNIDLAADVMKPILSKEQELKRLLFHSGAPVTRDICTHGTGKIPYIDAVGKIGVLSTTSASDVSKPSNAIKHFFPFHRTQICNYSELSPILYDLVRNVMSIPLNDIEEDQLAHKWDSEKACVRLKKEIKMHVKQAFLLISSIYNDAPNT